MDDEYRAMCFLCGWRGCMRPPIAARNELDVHLASDDHRFLVEGFSELWARHTT